MFSRKATYSLSVSSRLIYTSFSTLCKGDYSCVHQGGMEGEDIVNLDDSIQIQGYRYSLFLIYQKFPHFPNVHREINERLAKQMLLDVSQVT